MKAYSRHKDLFFLLRHGRTLSSGRRHFIGTTNVPLSLEGIEQAVYWNRAFESIPLDRVISSRLERCRHTAGLIRKHENIITNKQLNEIHLGEWENQAFDTIRNNCPQDFKKRGQSIDSFKIPGAESFKDVADRVIPLFEDTLKTGGRTLWVTHAGVIRVLLCHILNQPLNRLLDHKPGFGELFVIQP